MFFGFEVFIGIFIGVLIATIVVLIMHIRTTLQMNKLTLPAYEYAMKKAEHDAHALVLKAQEEARAIIADAEKEGHKAIARYTQQAQEIHEKYKEVVANQTDGVNKRLLKASEVQVQALQKVVAAAEVAIAGEQKKITEKVEQTNKLLVQAAAKAEDHTQETIRELQKRVEQVGHNLEVHLNTIQEAGEKKLAEHLAALQKTAEKHVEAYEASRIQLLDAHIEQLVDAVVMKVLHTQLPVSKHASLAREALEEAKSQNII